MKATKILLGAFAATIFPHLGNAQPVNRWSAEGNALDSIGTAHGTVAGAGYGTGESGQAFAFVEEGSYVDFGTGVGNFGTNDFSVSFWIQTLGEGDLPVIARRSRCGIGRSTGPGNRWGIRIHNGIVNAELIQDAFAHGPYLRLFPHPNPYVQESGVAATRAIHDGLFHHVALAREGTNVTLFIDGELQAVGSSTNVLTLTNSASLRAGSVCNVSFPGSLDEIEIYDHALSTSEVQALFNPNNDLRIIAQPRPQDVALGTNLTLSVTVIGATAAQATYQWKLDGVSIASATNSSYTIAGVQSYDTGTYTVEVSDSSTTLTSVPFTLTAFPVQPVMDWVWWPQPQGSASQLRGPANIVTLEGGHGFKVELKSDGNVLAYDDYYGEYAVSTNVFDVVDVAASAQNSLALKRDGTVISWRLDHLVDDGWNVGSNLVNVATPSSLVNIAAISAGTYHYLALKNNGTVIAWGSNDKGQCNVPAGLSNVVAITAGNAFSMALQSDGTVVSWGQNVPGIIYPSGGTKVIALAGNQDNKWLLKDDGSVVGYSVTSGYGSAYIPPAANVVGIAACGPDRLVWLRNDGHAFVNDFEIATNAIAVNPGRGNGYAMLGSGAPGITVHPANQVPGSSVTFNVMAASSSAVNYQWQLNGTNIPGATDASLTITDAAEIAAAGNYTVVASNSAGSVTSKPATLFPNPIPGVIPVPTGNYTGLFCEEDEVTHQSSGLFKLTLAKKHAFSGSVTVNGKKHSFSGKFFKRKAQKSIYRPGDIPLNMELELNDIPGTEHVSGSITDGNWTAGVEGDKAAAGKHVLPHAGSYTLTLPSQSDGVAGPGGTSIGTVVIKTNGTVTFGGSLSDNTAVSQTVPISKDGVWPLYAGLYKGSGSVLGWVTMTHSEDNAINAINANISWIKTGAFGKMYPNGFTNLASAVGSTLSVSTNENVLEIADGVSVLSGADLSSEVTHDVDTTPKQLIFTASNGTVQKLAVNPRTGFFSGSLLNAATKKKVPVKGVVMQQQNTAEGYITGATQTGSFSLQEE